MYKEKLQSRFSPRRDNWDSSSMLKIPIGTGFYCEINKEKSLPITIKGLRNIFFQTIIFTRSAILIVAASSWERSFGDLQFYSTKNNKQRHYFIGI